MISIKDIADAEGIYVRFAIDFYRSGYIKRIPKEETPEGFKGEIWFADDCKIELPPLDTQEGREAHEELRQYRKIASLPRMTGEEGANFRRDRAESYTEKNSLETFEPPEPPITPEEEQEQGQKEYTQEEYSKLIIKRMKEIKDDEDTDFSPV